MHIKYFIGAAVVIILALLMTADIFADHEKKNVTPYGDFCRKCSQYGKCDTTMSHDDARKAMTEYYQDKGLRVEIDKKRGRFIKAKIKDRDNVVDVIIFDRHTGRIRSIY